MRKLFFILAVAIANPAFAVGLGDDGPAAPAGRMPSPSATIPGTPAESPPPDKGIDTRIRIAEYGWDGDFDSANARIVALGYVEVPDDSYHAYEPAVEITVTHADGKTELIYLTAGFAAKRGLSFESFSRLVSRPGQILIVTLGDSLSFSPAIATLKIKYRCDVVLGN